MTSEPIMVRSEHPAEWLAALPVLVGYELTDRATITFTGHAGQLICVAAVPHAASTRQITDILAAQADSIRREGVRATWTTVHGLDPTNAWVRSQILAEAVAASGLPRPYPEDQFAVDGTHAWPVAGMSATPDTTWDLSEHPAVRDRLELLLGTPADTRDDVGSDLAAAPSPLRDEIAGHLPEAASNSLARTEPTQWRIDAAVDTLARLTDPRPWTGRAAADALLSLSDHRVLAHLLAHTMKSDTHALSAPDTGLLADLVRAAPPGLVAGPATLLAGRLAGQGLTSARARTAASLAIVDRPDATAALALLAALDRGDNPRALLADLAERSPSLADPIPPLFTAGSGTWPDALVTPRLGMDSPELTDPNARDPLAACDAGDPLATNGPELLTPPQEGRTP
jgi:hypothetical protein